MHVGCNRLTKQFVSLRLMFVAQVCRRQIDVIDYHSISLKAKLKPLAVHIWILDPSLRHVAGTNRMDMCNVINIIIIINYINYDAWSRSIVIFNHRKRYLVIRNKIQFISDFYESQQTTF